MTQGVRDWYYERTGMITASRFKDVMAFGKQGQSLQARENYLAEIVVERLTEEPLSTPDNYAMQWGRDMEPYARTAYEVKTGSVVIETDFVRLNDHCGASPDGLINDDGLLEIKCPVNSIIHIRTITDGMPKDHIAQVQGQIWVTDRQWCDFVSYDSRMPENLRIYVERVERDDKFITELAAAVEQFNGEVDATIDALRERAA